MKFFLATCLFVPSVLASSSCRTGGFGAVLSQHKSVDVVAPLRDHVQYMAYLNREDLEGRPVVFPTFVSKPDCNYRITLQSQFQEGAATLTFVGNDSSAVCFMVDVGPPTKAAPEGGDSIESICDTAGPSASGTSTSEAISNQSTSTGASSVSDSGQNPQTGSASTPVTTATNPSASPNQTPGTPTSKGSTSSIPTPGKSPTSSSTPSDSDHTDLPTSTKSCACS